MAKFNILADEASVGLVQNSRSPSYQVLFPALIQFITLDKQPESLIDSLESTATSSFTRERKGRCSSLAWTNDLIVERSQIFRYELPSYRLLFSSF